MGRVFVVEIEEQSNYKCRFCHTSLAVPDSILSKSYNCRLGRAFLFGNVVNITFGPHEEKMMLTGLHTVQAIFCCCCGQYVGWKYIAAHDENEKFKEGKFVLESNSEPALFHNRRTAKEDDKPFRLGAHGMNRSYHQAAAAATSLCFFHVDFSKDKDSKGHNNHLGSESSMPEKSRSKPSSNILAIGENSKKDSKASPMSSKNCSETELQSHLYHSVTKETPTTVSFNRDGKEVADVIMTQPFSVFISEDKTKKTDMQSGNDKKRVTSRLATGDIKAESSSPGANLKNGSKRPAMMCDFYAKGWCIKGSSCKFLHVKDDVDNVNQQHGKDAATRNGKEEAKLEQGGARPRCNFPNGYTNHGSIIDNESPRVKNSLLPEFRTSSDFLRSLPYGGNFGDLSQYMANKTNGIFPTRHISTWTNSSFPPIPCSFSEEHIYSQPAYLLRGYPSFSGSKPERTDYSDNWEPSVPFRPSFFMTVESTSSSGNQYDPLRDSTDDLPNTAEKSFKFFYSASGSSNENPLHQQANSDAALAEAKVLGANHDKNSAPSTVKSCEEKNCGEHEKDSNTSCGETVGASMVNGQTSKSPEEEKPSLSPKIDSNRVSTNKKDGSKLDRARHYNEAVCENNITDGVVQKESKAMRHFRASLIDLVKELLKPAWHKGSLTRDAHNLIVKKAVDKVVSTLQPQQIVLVESVGQYLSFARPKISKLVEAYIEKYEKP
ncbi:hypothetical protein ACFE04_020016 [Oxalis oulophora]